MLDEIDTAGVHKIARCSPISEPITGVQSKSEYSHQQLQHDSHADLSKHEDKKN